MAGNIGLIENTPMNSDSTLLQYGFNWEPQTISTGNMEALKIVFNSNTQISVNSSITITIPVGSDGASLTNDVNRIKYDVRDAHVWDITKNAGALPGTCDITLTYQGEDQISPGQGYFVTISDILVNEQTGNFTIKIEEKIDGKISYHTRTFSKFPHEFSLSNFKAEPIQLPESSGDVTLSWDARIIENMSLELSWTDGGVKQTRIEHKPTQKEDNLNNPCRVMISGNTIFALTGTYTDSVGTSVTSIPLSCTVLVTEEPRINSYTIDKTNITLGESIILEWSTSGAARCELYSNGVLIKEYFNPYKVELKPTCETIYFVQAYGHTGNKGGTCYFPTVEVYQLIKSSKIEVLSPGDIVITPNGRHAYVAREKMGDVVAIDTETNKVSAEIGVWGGVAASMILVVAPDGKYVYLTHSATYKVYAIETENNKISHYSKEIGTDYFAAMEIAITPNGERLYVNNSKTIYVLETSHLTEISRIDAKTSSNIEISSDGRYEYFYVNEEGVFVREIENNEMKLIPIKNPLNIVAPRNCRYTYISSMSEEGTGFLWVIDGRQIIDTIEIQNYPIAITAAPEGKHVYLISLMDASVTIIDVLHKNILYKIGDLGGGFWSIAVTSNDNRMYLTGYSDNCVTVFVKTLIKHQFQSLNTKTLGVQNESQNVSASTLVEYVSSPASESTSDRVPLLFSGLGPGGPERLASTTNVHDEQTNKKMLQNVKFTRCCCEIS